MHVRKIVILGPESTGKSVLCQQLADHFNTLWCPEYAREYLLQNGTAYNYDDLLTIAQNQLRTEDEYTRRLASGSAEKPLLFVDTDMYVMKVWCEFVFNNCHRYILDKIIERQYDFYLLCNTELPWVKDELREYPDLVNRQRLFNIYKDLLLNQPVPWAIVSGDYATRLPSALGAINEFFSREASTA